MFAKTFVVLFFVLALQRQREVYKENRIAGAIGFAILLAIGAWFYKVSINAKQVFKKRGIIEY